MKTVLKVGLFAVVMLSAVRAEAQQNIQTCVPGMRVVTEAGLHGSIDHLERYYCFVRYDSGQVGMEFIYTLYPEGTSGGNPNAPLTDGEYSCVVSYGGFSHPNIVPMGKMDIRGMAYRFRPFGNVTQGWAAYAVGPGGTLRWGGKMGGLDIAPSVLIGSKKMPFGKFNIEYRVKPGSLSDSMVCSKT